MWDLPTGCQLRVMDQHTAWVRCVAWSPVCDTIVSVGGDRTVVVWKPTALDTLASSVTVLRCHTHIAWQVAFSPSGAAFATVSEDGSAAVLDAASLHQLACFAPLTGMRAVCFADEDSLVCGGGDGTLFTVALRKL
jgi:WD40 repeat protein